jgi:hypothetical protein
MTLPSSGLKISQQDTAVTAGSKQIQTTFSSITSVDFQRASEDGLRTLNSTKSDLIYGLEPGTVGVY